MPHGPRIPDDDLRAMARERIADGRLPILFPDTLHAGYGTGTTCDLCGQPIERHQIDYEVTDRRNGRSLSLHLACHAIWQLECRAHSLHAGGGGTNAGSP